MPLPAHQQELAILFEDDALLVADKPSGLLVVPGRGEDEAPPLRRRLEERLGRPGWVVPRRDQATSGAIVFAKTAEAHRFLSREFENRRVRKIYLGLAAGRIEREGILRMPIREFGSGRMGVSRRGKPAVTRYRPLEVFADSTLVEIAPLTGRRHQIRVHFYAIGHPVLGDPLYGENRPVGGAARLMLHALYLAFRHPGGEEVAVEAPPGADWKSVLRFRPPRRE